MIPSDHVALQGCDGRDPPTLRRGRVHEVCGPARRSLAVLLARAADGPAIWIGPTHAGERLHAPGLAEAGLNPGKLTLVDCAQAEDLLWSAEEALRHLALAGAGGVVIVDLAAPPRLTPVRRLHLAAGGAEAGAAERKLPLGLLLAPEGGGAQGIESRWHIAPDHAPDRTVWTLERRRARGSPPAAWQMEGGQGPSDGTLTLRRVGAPDPYRHGGQ